MLFHKHPKKKSFRFIKECLTHLVCRQVNNFFVQKKRGKNSQVWNSFVSNYSESPWLRNRLMTANVVQESSCPILTVAKAHEWKTDVYGFVPTLVYSVFTKTTWRELQINTLHICHTRIYMENQKKLLLFRSGINQSIKSCQSKKKKSLSFQWRNSLPKNLI